MKAILVQRPDHFWESVGSTGVTSKEEWSKKAWQVEGSGS